MKKMLYRTMQLFKKNITLCILLLVLYATSYAQVSQSVYIEKAKMSTGITRTLVDNDPTDSADGTYVNRFLGIRLKYTRNLLTDYKTYPYWTYQVICKIANAADTTQYFLDTLKITSGESPLDCHYFDEHWYTLRPGWKGIKMRPLSVCATTTPTGNCLSSPDSYPNIPNDIELQAVMESRVIKTLQNVNVTGQEIKSLPVVATADITHALWIDCELDMHKGLSWSNVANAVEYELEWVFIPEDLYYNDGGTMVTFNSLSNASTLAFTQADPVRIITNKTYHPLPVEYPGGGKLYFRVRGIGRLIDNVNQSYDQPVFFPWTYNMTTIITYATDFTTASSGYNNRNWQRTTTFAEDGKFKKVIGYFDGLNRSRQSLTHISADNTTIVQENIYDAEGRGSVSIIPYPEKCIDLTYRSGLHKDMAGNEWNKTDFELEASLPDGVKLNNTAGASKYFSVQNPFMGLNMNEYSMYVPDANKFPYTRTEFLRDGTGRISRTSGVGKDHQLGSGHETKYFYGKPSDMELRRLFGSNVGTADHYQKNMVLDANGQASVSYTDLSGKVVATSLAGNNPNNLVKLNSYDTIPVTANVFGYMDPLNGPTIEESCIDYTVTASSAPMNIKVHYKIPYTLFQSVNPDFETCLGCDYGLTISGTGMDGGIAPFSRNFTVNPTIASCSITSSPAYFQWDTTITVTAVGTYTFGRCITWESAAAEADILAALQLPNPVTQQVYDDLLEHFESEIDTTDCDFLLTQPGHTYDIETAIDAAMKSECNGMLAQMKLQLSPGGYYMMDADPVAPGHQFNDFDLATPGNQTIIDAIDDHYALLNLSHLSGTALSLAQATDIDYLETHWLPAWAETLAVNLHPEYCHYVRCNQYIDSGSSYQDYLMTRDTSVTQQYDDNQGYMYTFTTPPLGSANIFPYDVNPFTPADGFTGPINDPYPYQSMLYDKFSYYNTEDFIERTLWEYAYHTTHPTAFPAGFNLGYNVVYTSVTPPVTITADALLWNVYRGAYLQGKKVHWNSPGVRALYPSGCPMLAIDDAVVKDLPEINNINDMQEFTDEFLSNVIGPSSGLCSTSCENKARIILDNMLGDCASLYELENNPAFTTSIHNILDIIENYCISGCDPSDPYGAVLQSEIAAAETTITHPLYPIFAEITSLGTALNSAGYPSCGSMGNSVHIIESFDDNAFYTTETAEICHVVSCFSDSADVGNYILNVLGNAITDHFGDFSPQSFSGASAECTLCGCLPQPTIITGADDKYYPSYSCIPLSKNCSSPVNCTEVYDEHGAAVSPNNIVVNMGGYDIYTSPQYQFECTDCYIKFYNNPLMRPQDEYSVSKIASIDNMASITQDPSDPLRFTGSFTYHTYINNVPPGIGMTVNTASGAGNIYFELNLHGCPGPLVCDETTYNYLNYENETTYNYDTMYHDCVELLYQQAAYQADLALQEYISQQASVLLNEMEATCKNVQEEFTIKYTVAEYHYTLYYYDQAGNLVQTVPPEGVRPVPAVAFNALGNWNGTTEPAHKLATVYTYNSLDQPIYQYSPDGGYAYFQYDDKGRITHSLNQRQRESFVTVSGTQAKVPYSFTEYDALGRVSKVCQRTYQFLHGGTLALNPLTAPGHTIQSQADAEITKTFYNSGTWIASVNFKSENTLSRVAYTTYQDVDGAQYDAAVHYSYDIHGNVKTLVNEINALINFGNNRYKRIDYKYDQVSGKMNEVHYQAGKNDKFFYKYLYDGDNRLIMAETSSDYISFETDARYFYYYHGPLARVELGRDKVQGLDYSYTIQGWLKGINSGYLLPDDDMGKDGYVNVSNLNKNVARDAYGLVLDYYTGEYEAAGRSLSASLYKSFQATNAGDIATAWYDDPANTAVTSGLYNGNIVRTHTALMDISNNSLDVLGSVFQYDQLQRIRKSKVFSTNTVHSTKTYNTITQSPKYNTEYTYDNNGNLKTLRRAGNNNTTVGTYDMDSFSYKYSYVGADLSLNRLVYMTDSASSGGYTADLDTQLPGNYSYDGTGNLVSDASEQISKIEWTVYGKVRKITRTSGSVKPDLEFSYDPNGHRILKIEKTKTGTGTLKAEIDWIYTIYSRDAEGNPLCLYHVKKSATGNFYQLSADEYTLYGSEQLGIYKSGKNIINGSCRPHAHYSQVNTGSIELCQPTGVSAPGNPVLLSTNPTTTGLTISYSTISPDFKPALGSSNLSNVMILTSYISLLHGKQDMTGKKQYELKDHLGNVMATISDKKIGVVSGGGSAASYYVPVVLTYSDYYPFGMQMPGRNAVAQPCSTIATIDTIAAFSDNLGTNSSVPSVSPPNASQTGYYMYPAATSAAVSGGTLNCSKTAVTSIVNSGVARNFVLLPNKTYTITFKAKGSALPSGGAHWYEARILKYTASNTGTNAQVITVAINASTFTTNSITFTTDGTAYSNTYMFNVYAHTNAAYTMNIDDINLTYTDKVYHNVCGTGDSYRYGYNDQEKDNEVTGADATSYTAEYWQYDPRLGRRWNVDPEDIASESAYAAFRNNPIIFNDPKGDFPGDGDGKGATSGYGRAGSSIGITGNLGINKAINYSLRGLANPFIHTASSINNFASDPAGTSWAYFKTDGYKNLIPGYMTTRAALIPIRKTYDLWGNIISAGRYAFNGRWGGAFYIAGQSYGAHSMEAGITFATMGAGSGIKSAFMAWTKNLPKLPTNTKFYQGIGPPGSTPGFGEVDAGMGGESWTNMSGILRDAIKGKGNYGLGSGNVNEAMQAGRSWVGEGFTISKDGSSWISANGLRQFRPPSFKIKLGIEQANFQWRNVNKGAWQSNGHLNIIKP